MSLQIIRNDITKVNADILVNCANPEPKVGGGTDFAIYNAAGMEAMLEARIAIGNIPVGDVAVTLGYNLGAKYVLHAVGPIWEGGTCNEDALLASCYRKSLEMAESLQVQSIAFPLLSTGIYKFPRKRAISIAISEIRKFLSRSDMTVYLVVFDDLSTIATLEDNPIDDIAIDDSYATEKLEWEYNIDKKLDEYIGRKYIALNAPSFYSASIDGIKEESPAIFSEPTIAASVYDRRDEAKGRTDRKPLFGLGKIKSDKTGRESSKIASKPRTLESITANLGKTFMEMIYFYADNRGMTDADLYRGANIDKKAFNKIKNGVTKNPSKATAMALAVGLHLSLDETKDLLSRAGYALSPCSVQDLIVEFYIEQEVYDIDLINLALFEHNVGILGSQVM